MDRAARLGGPVPATRSTLRSRKASGVAFTDAPTAVLHRHASVIRQGVASTTSQVDGCRTARPQWSRATVDWSHLAETRDAFARQAHASSTETTVGLSRTAYRSDRRVCRCRDVCADILCCVVRPGDLPSDVPLATAALNHVLCVQEHERNDSADDEYVPGHWSRAPLVVDRVFG